MLYLKTMSVLKHKVIVCNLRIQIIIPNIGNSHKIVGAKFFIVCSELQILLCLSLTIIASLRNTKYYCQSKINDINSKLIYYVSRKNK